MTHFKVLPTDPRFQSLNLFQKLMLVSAMRDDFKFKFEIGKGLFDKALLYMNPEIWLKEKEHSGEMPPGKYDKINTEFKQIQTQGRATGVMPENTMIAKAIKQFFDSKGKIAPQDRIVLRGELDDLQEFKGAQLPTPTPSDELG